MNKLETRLLQDTQEERDFILKLKSQVKPECSVKELVYDYLDAGLQTGKNDRVINFWKEHGFPNVDVHSARLLTNCVGTYFGLIEFDQAKHLLLELQTAYKVYENLAKNDFIQLGVPSMPTSIHYYLQRRKNDWVVKGMPLYMKNTKLGNIESEVEQNAQAMTIALEKMIFSKISAIAPDVSEIRHTDIVITDKIGVKNLSKRMNIEHLNIRIKDHVKDIIVTEKNQSILDHGLVLAMYYLRVSGTTWCFRGACKFTKSIGTKYRKFKLS